MYLESLQLQGFKSFANKILLKFLPPTEKSRGITAIVGPNGSGKSNSVDAFRWVLGEQSIKILRGKKTEDVIFAGSDKRARSGFAEVSLILKNENFKDKAATAEENEKSDYFADFLNRETVEITRRVYRDGVSEYSLGSGRTRLSDIQLLLARLGVGTKTYGIIGQGMIESILTMNEAEKKEFFDDATGIKQYQIKKNQSLLQLKNASANMKEALMIIQEIEPHLRYLKRQVHRLEEKAKLEDELHALQHSYYGFLYRDLMDKIKTQKEKLKNFADGIEEAKRGLNSLVKKSESATYLDTHSPITNLQEKYQKLLEEKSKIMEKELQIKNKIWQLKQNFKKAQTPSVNIAEVVSRIEKIEKAEQEMALMLKEKNANLLSVVEKLDEIMSLTRELNLFLKQHDSAALADTKNEEKELENLQSQIEALGKNIAAAKQEIEDAYRKEEEGKKDFVALQKEIQTRREKLYFSENQLNELKIELARLETRQETLENEMREELKERVERIKKAYSDSLNQTVRSRSEEPFSLQESPEIAYQKIQKLKYQIALAGGVDDHVVKEYNETNHRYEFLKTQTDDLKKSIADLKGIIAELDIMIEKQFNQSFNKINAGFGKYFKVLFGGGNASIVKKEIPKELPKEESGVPEQNPAKNTPPQEPDADEFADGNKYFIEINAAPPGKKVKGIQMLSGGERALTAIALICGIISCNPSPFIILDEVDAALDETNSMKFSNIIKELSQQSQFIIITHNRATMENASLLYGVTMGDDGTSKILSVDLREAEKMVE